MSIKICLKYKIDRKKYSDTKISTLLQKLFDAITAWRCPQ